MTLVLFSVVYCLQLKHVIIYYSNNFLGKRKLKYSFDFDECTQEWENLWSYKTGGSVYGGMSISKGCMYVGHGYCVALDPALSLTSGATLFAFYVVPKNLRG